MVKEGVDFPYEIQDVEPELAEELMKHFTEKTGFVRVGPKGYFFPIKFKEYATSFYNMEVRENDIFVVTFPRSGVAGDWINYFDQQMIEETTKWLEYNLKDTDLVYPSYTSYK